MDESRLNEWITKPEAAAILKISERTLDRMADEGKVKWLHREFAGQRRTRVFDPDEIREMAKRKGIAPSDSDSQGLVRVDPQQLLAVMQAQKQVEPEEPEPEEQPATLPPSELRFKRYLTTAEAVAYTGLSGTYLAELAKSGKVTRINKGYRGAAVYRRTDLDEL